MDNSLQIMEQFDKAIKDIDSLKSEISEVESVIEEKTKIINSILSFNNEKIKYLMDKKAAASEDRIIFGFDNDKNKIVGGNCQLFGTTLHPSFVKVPSDVFNYVSDIGSIYKNNGTVEFYTTDENGIVKNKRSRIRYSDVLKWESVCNSEKTDLYEVFSENHITMAIQATPSMSMSSAQFNMIELKPYLAGSFDIESIRIFTIDQYYKNDMEVPDKTVTYTYEDVGTSRILLDATYNFYRVEFDIKLKYQNNGYPFGLKELKFIKADMDLENSYAVLEIEKENYIASVGDEIAIISPEEKYNSSTIDKLGIKYYMYYENEVLDTEISGTISRNIKKFYVKLPLNRPLIGIVLKNIKTR